MVIYMPAARLISTCYLHFLLNRQTTNNDHTPLSLACAGGHLAVDELNGHTQVVHLLLDYPNSILLLAKFLLQLRVYHLWEEWQLYWELQI